MHAHLCTRDLVTPTAGTWAGSSQGVLSPCPRPMWAAPCNPASPRVLPGNWAFIQQMEEGQASPTRLPGAACPPTAPGASPRSQASPPGGLTQPGPLLGWGKAGEGPLEAEVSDPRVQPPPKEPHPFPISPRGTGSTEPLPGVGTAAGGLHRCFDTPGRFGELSLGVEHRPLPHSASPQDAAAAPPGRGPRKGGSRGKQRQCPEPS